METDFCIDRMLAKLQIQNDVILPKCEEILLRENFSNGFWL